MSHGSSSTSCRIVRVSRILGHLAKARRYISCRGALSCQEGWSGCGGIIQVFSIPTSVVSFRLSSHHHMNQNNPETRDQTSVPTCLWSLVASFSRKNKKRQKNKVSQVNIVPICFGTVGKEKAAEQFLLLHAVMWHFVYTRLLG